MHDPRFYSLVLHRLPGLGAAGYKRLVDAFGSPEKALAQPVINLQGNLKPDAQNSLRDFQISPEASAIGGRALADLEWLDAQPDVHLVDLASPAYPDLLREISKMPPLLFVRGDVSCLGLPQLAVVGSRNPTGGGRENAHRFAEFMATHGFAITSGLALGVDGAAHEGALAAQGRTVAVMGTGIDKIYPARHRDLAQRILDAGGALVSELPLGTGSLAANFPQRNRIISGLSHGVLVVEAALQSGSLITAHIALQQNREVFAIPGSIHNPLARGCHQLVRQGATLVETGQDIVDQLQGMLGFEREKLSNRQRTGPKLNENDEVPGLLSQGERHLIHTMGFDPVSLDELAERTGLAIGSLAAQLVSLELKGIVEQRGTAFQRI